MSATLPVLSVPVQSPPSPVSMISASRTSSPIATTTTLSATALPGVRTSPSPVSLLQSASIGSAPASARVSPVSSRSPVQLPSLTTIQSAPASPTSMSPRAMSPRVSTPSSPRGTATLPSLPSLGSRVASPVKPASLPSLGSMQAILPSVGATTVKVTTIKTPPRGTAQNSYNTPSKKPVFDTPRSLASKTASSAAGGHDTTNISAMGYKLDENSVDYMLEEKGFTPMSRVLLRGPDGKTTASHIKVNVNGLMAYVELDGDDGFVMRRNGDPLLVYNSDSAIVPLSVERSVYECVGDLGCGAVFECEDGICTLSRSDTSQIPRRVVMTIADRSTNRIAKSSDDIIAYPVVRLSEVMCDAVAAERTIREATCRIRNAAFDKMAKDIKETDEVMTKLHCTYEHFQKNFLKAWTVLRDQICELEKARNSREKLAADGCLSEEEECKHRMVLYNLRVRNEMVASLLRYDLALKLATDDAANLTSGLTNLNERLVEEFKCAGKIYEH